jgi:hypothetical protein
MVDVRTLYFPEWEYDWLLRGLPGPGSYDEKLKVKSKKVPAFTIPKNER